ncbi:MAG TPA: hypothetical protein VN749_03465, partial [Candidatus Eisenbacteria bacterium]|nr:hypothetical protein [Candidatus Eisenbacteria bacterium]
MNSASSADSIKYSGQWVLSASAADRRVCLAGTNPSATGEETIAASAEFVMSVSVMRDGIPTATGSDRNTQRNLEAHASTKPKIFATKPRESHLIAISKQV